MKNLPVILPDMDEGIIYLGTTESFFKDKFIKVGIVSFNDLYAALDSYKTSRVKDITIEFYQDGVEMIQDSISIFFDIDVLTNFLMWTEKDDEKSFNDDLKILKNNIGEYNKKHSPEDTAML